MSHTPITPSQPPGNESPSLRPLGADAADATRVPAPNSEALAAIESTVARLRAELAGTSDKARQARLLAEIGEIEERAGDEPGAARDYLAAFNAEPTFREPLEGLVRLLERRRSLKNLGRLVDALARAAQNPDERARALLMKAAYLEDVASDLGGAKTAARDATIAEAPPAETASAWLALELLAAKDSDAVLREEALTERAKFAADPTWRGLVLMDVARLAAANGDVDRALAVLSEASALGAGATYPAALAIERLTRKEPGIAGSEEARARSEAHAAALESQAMLVHEAVTTEERGEGLGVPRWTRNATMMADAWLRAAETRHAMGELGKAGAILDRAREVMAASEGAGVVVPPLVEAALVSARIRIAEMMGDTALAASLAQQRMSKEQDGGVAAALAMRVAEHAASEGDGARALEALSRAIQSDPACIPARALQLDLLADGGDTTAFAAQLESFADHLATDEARGRAFLLAAYVWAVRAGDTAGAKAALSQAAMFGVAPATVARLARAMASLKGDAAWYEDATKRLIASSTGGGAESDLVPLWVELVRTRFARGDADGAAKALRELGNAPKGAWLGRVLEAFLPEAIDPERTHVRGDDRRRTSLDELAGIEPDADIARGLGLLAAMRAHAGGDVEGARQRLGDLSAKEPGDALVVAYLADLERASGNHGAAARAASSAAEASAGSDTELAAAFHLECGFEKWKDGDRRGAIEAFERATEHAPAAAKIVLGWASHAIDVDVVEGRRKALERALDGGGDARLVALERFATEMGGGDAEEARAALDVLDRDAVGDLAVAGALARMTWSLGGSDEAARRSAFARIASLGAHAATFAAAEELRVARESGDADETARAARAWFDVGGSAAAALEWTAASMTVAQPLEERDARRALSRVLHGEAAEAMAASAALLEGASASGLSPRALPFLGGESPVTHLANLELAPPGSDPRRRATALVEIDVALGDDARDDALSLAGWSALTAGDMKAAIAAWEKVVTKRPEDLAAWEGLRTAAQLTGDKSLRARAAGELGARVSDAKRGAAFWEESALLWLELDEGSRAETALDAGFARDPKRPVAFDKLFRRVRERKDEADKLLGIINKRLDVTDEPQEIAKLFWEQARALRQKGDQDAALKSLEHVVMLEPDHVGALALTGEIALKRGLYDEAATALARLATLDAAPAKNRVTAGVAAVDIFENKLDSFDRALAVLLGLHRAGLSTLPVRERLARAAARTGSWKEATAILEVLMKERPEADGRIEAARLAMAIHRDRLHDPNGARAAIVKLLEESPADGEALDMLLSTEHPANIKAKLLQNARVTLLATVASRSTDAPSVRRLAKVARATDDAAMQQAALSVAVVLGSDASIEQQLAALAATKPRTPTTALTPALLRAVLAPGDEGPIADLFVTLGPTLAEALGPTIQACGVTKKDKVDPRSGLALRNEITAWTGAFGVPTFDLYVGGRDPLGVQGVPGETPALVVGSGVNAPLSPMIRARVARELLGIVRGTTIVRLRDDISIAAIVVAACRLAEVRIEHPPYAVLAEIDKLVSKAIARKTKKLLPEICRAIVSSGADARAWSKRAQLSQARAATIACGDVGLVLPDLLSESVDKIAAAVRGEPLAEELLRFVLSPAYLDLRRSFGLEGGS